MSKKCHRERVMHHPEQKNIRGGKLQQLVDDEYHFDDF
jgi:hypothetical protein